MVYNKKQTPINSKFFINTIFLMYKNNMIGINTKKYSQKL